MMRFDVGGRLLPVALTIVVPAAGPVAAQVSATKPAEARSVSFHTEDGVVIVGDYYAPEPKSDEKAPIVILLHMNRCDRSTWKPLVPYLHAAGFAVLAIDMRGHGESLEPKAFNLKQRVEKGDSKLYQAMHQDVAAAYVWLAAQENVDPARFALIGASVGCSVALDYAARDRSVDAIVCLTPGTNYLGLDSTGPIRRCESRSILMLTAKAEAGAANELRRIAAQASVQVMDDGRADGDGQALHGSRMLGKVKDIEKTIASHLVRAVGGPPKEPVVASVHSDIYHVPGTSHARRIKTENLRWFSSAAEARARGLRPVKQRGSEHNGAGAGAAVGPRASELPPAAEGKPTRNGRRPR